MTTIATVLICGFAVAAFAFFILWLRAPAPAVQPPDVTPTVHVFGPPLVPWADYVGAYQITEEPMRMPYASRRAAGLDLGDERFRHGDYWIGKADYIGEERARARMFNFGLATAATPADDPFEIVALLQHNTLWVHPNHRGKGLALALGVLHARLRLASYPQTDLLWPCLIDIRKRPDDLRRRRQTYTREGIELIRRIYLALVEEKLIDPGPGPLPTAEGVVASAP